MAARIFLYDADGNDQEIGLDAVEVGSIGDHKLLWVDVEGADKQELARIAELLKVDVRRLEIPAMDERPELENYGDFFCFAVDTAPSAPDPAPERRKPGLSVESEEKHREAPGSARVQFVVAQNWLVTVHETPVHCLIRFREQDKGETTIGLLSPQALAASLLDWHLGEYFQDVSRLEAAVDHLDERVLREAASNILLGRIVALRRRVSRLRALLVAQRDVFYGLSRPDFALVTESGAAPYYVALATRFERAVDEVERARDVVVGSFELFTSRTGQQTNDLVKMLTFLTAVVGFCAAVAGLLGMNFRLSIFDTGYMGFSIVIGSLIVIALIAVVIARVRRWI